MICRFNGHTHRFYSVAEHCLFVASRVESSADKLAALLHDASEAYLTDLTRPVKYRMEKYLDVEFNLMMVISRKYGFQYPLSVAVKDADDFALKHEWLNNVVNDRVSTLTPPQARLEFLKQLDMLVNHVHTELI
jgi:5'-deoxynucleotidase YfbR-like HD superfamily hydrolase